MISAPDAPTWRNFNMLDFGAKRWEKSLSSFFPSCSADAINSPGEMPE